MDLDHLVSQMAEDAQRIRVLVDGISDRQAHWKPDPASWSILEVASHLLDEEKEDISGFESTSPYIAPTNPGPASTPKVG